MIIFHKVNFRLKFVKILSRENIIYTVLLEYVRILLLHYVVLVKLTVMCLWYCIVIIEIIHSL